VLSVLICVTDSIAPRMRGTAVAKVFELRIVAIGIDRRSKIDLTGIRKFLI